MLYLYEIIFNYIYDANIIIISIFAIKKIWIKDGKLIKVVFTT